MGFRELFEKYSKADTKFTKHAKIKISEMNFDENFVIDKLFDINKLIYEEYQEPKKTYKLVYEHSKEYLIVIVVSLNKNLNIVTAYKTSKRIQKLIKDKGIVHISKIYKK